MLKDYNNQVNQIISSRYSKGLFLQTQTKNGYIYNVSLFFYQIDLNLNIKFYLKFFLYQDNCKRRKTKRSGTSFRRIFSII